MPKGTNQKLKLYYLAKIMVEKTDDEHMITMPEIQKALEAYGVTADRKSLYDDIETLGVLGIDTEGWSVTNVDVALSDHFYGWIFALGSKVKLLGPEDVVGRFREELKNMLKCYEE